jgi:hypothetical protein
MSAKADTYPVPSEDFIRSVGMEVDFVFRHKGGFILVMRTAEAARTLAEFAY